MQLHIKVIEAKEVPKMDVFGKADPFCILQMSHIPQNYITKVIKSTYTPYWNQEFHIPVANPAEDVLTITMADEDKGSTNDNISKIEIKMSDLTPSVVFDHWYQMEPFPGVKAGGKLRLCTHLGPSGELPFKPDQHVPA